MKNPMKIISLTLGLGMLLGVACHPPTPAQEASAVKAAIDGGRAGCLIAAAKGVELTDAQKAWCRLP